MTCIAAIKKDGKVFIAGDRAGTGGYVQHNQSEPKIFQVGEFLIGYSGCYRMAQIVRYHTHLPKPREDQEIVEFIVTEIVSSIRRAMIDQGANSKERGADMQGGGIIIGYRGRIFRIESNYQVFGSNDDYTAMGSGGEVALGALYALRSSKESPKRKLKTAIHAANYHTPYCGYDVDVMQI